MLLWFWRAFERREDVDLFVVGPFTGDWIPWTTVPGDTSGMRLPQKYVKTPNLPLTPGIPVMPVRAVEIQTKNWCDNPDLWLEIDAGYHFLDRPKAKVVAQLQTDPHVLRGFYNQVKSKYDYVFTMQDCYREEGEIYIPYAHDPTVHYPMRVDKEYDACLIGLHYPQRDELVQRLRMQGLKVFYDLGLIMDEYRLMFNKSKIGLNWSTLKDLNARFFEIPAMGLPMITNHVPDAEKFLVNREDYLEFETIEEAEKFVVLLLDEEGMRNRIATNGKNKIQTETYDARVQQILEVAKLI